MEDQIGYSDDPVSLLLSSVVLYYGSLSSSINLGSRYLKYYGLPNPDPSQLIDKREPIDRFPERPAETRVRASCHSVLYSLLESLYSFLHLLVRWSQTGPAR